MDGGAQATDRVNSHDGRDAQRGERLVEEGEDRGGRRGELGVLGRYGRGGEERVEAGVLVREDAARDRQAAQVVEGLAGARDGACGADAKPIPAGDGDAATQVGVARDVVVEGRWLDAERASETVPSEALFALLLDQIERGRDQMEAPAAPL